MPDDNGKNLVCSINHKTLLDPDNASVPVSVVCEYSTSGGVDRIRYDREGETVAIPREQGGINMLGQWKES